MTGQPYLCPQCGCPIQHLATTAGEIIGTIEDAYADHCRVVHPEDEE